MATLLNIKEFAIGNPLSFIGSSARQALSAVSGRRILASTKFNKGQLLSAHATYFVAVSDWVLKVPLHMSAERNYLQVLYSVISLYAVLVMDAFLRPKMALKVLFHDPTVLEDGFPITSDTSVSPYVRVARAVRAAPMGRQRIAISNQFMIMSRAVSFGLNWFETLINRAYIHMPIIENSYYKSSREA